MARSAPAVAALLVVLILLGGPLAFGIGWSVDLVGWLVLATTFTAVGAMIVARVPENPFGWVLLSIGVTSALTVSTASADVAGVLAWLRSWIAFVPIGLLPVGLLLFPTGRLPSARWRPALALAAGGVAATTFFLAVASALEPDPLGLYGPAAGPRVAGLLVAARVGALVTVIAMALAAMALAQRVRHASDVERRQVLCLLLGAIALLLGLLLEFAGVTAAWVIGAAALPVAAGVAILWHRLYDLDLFLNRSLVYGTLSLALLAAFAAIVTLGNHVAASLLPHGAWTLVAGGLVALGLDPLRRRLQRAVDRLLYGDRDDPYAVVTALGRGLSSADQPTTMLADVAEAVARSLALPYVAIEVNSPAGEVHTVEWGRRHGETVALPLKHRGEQIGRLLVAPRTVTGSLSEADRKLLADIAHPVALTVSAVELSTGLQRAREQLVTAREEERRRLRRDLHDGLGPTLAAMVMQLDAASNVLRRDPAAVEPLLAGLRSAAQEAVGDIRRLVYELRPPALDELGLVGAISESIERFNGHGEESLRLSLDAPTSLPSLPAAVEVATLRIVQEALANVARHSGARSCVVALARGGGADRDALVVEVRDDGRGLPDDLRLGVGLDSMRERAAEVGGTCTITSPVGGGARVHAILPLATP